MNFSVFTQRLAVNIIDTPLVDALGREFEVVTAPVVFIVVFVSC